MSVIDRVPLADQIAEVRREIEMRRRTYIRMVDQAKMTTAEAERRTLNMCGVLQTLEQVRDLGEPVGGDNNNNGEHHDNNDAREIRTGGYLNLRRWRPGSKSASRAPMTQRQLGLPRSRARWDTTRCRLAGGL